MINRQNKLDQAVACRDDAMAHLKYVRDQTGSDRVRTFATSLEDGMWRSISLWKQVIRDLEQVCLGKSAPVKHYAREYEELWNQVPEFHEEFRDLYQIIPMWEAAAQSAQEPGYQPLPDDFRSRLAIGAGNATHVIDHALRMYRSFVESANGFEIAPRRRRRRGPAPLRHNTIREVASGLARIRRDLPQLERDIAVDLAMIKAGASAQEDVRQYLAEARALTWRAHRFHVDMVERMDDWMLSSGSLVFDEAGYLRLRQRQFDHKAMTCLACHYYGIVRNQSWSLPKPKVGLQTSLFRTVDLAKTIIADSLDACEELVMAATGLPVEPQLWRGDC